MAAQAGQIETAHIPVLLHEVIDVLALRPGDVVVDGTAGGGGHAQAILTELGPKGVYLGIDLDARALARTHERLGDDPRVTLVEGNFRDIERLMAAHGLTHADRILLDLGLSSDQLVASEDTGRGFSFTRDEPLLMTLADTPDEEVLTARDVVNTWSEESLADIIYGFGGETRARRIAQAIVEARAAGEITTSGQLAEIVERAVGRRGAAHPATRTFQAIRIAVNDELGALADALTGADRVLAPGGRIAVISFHSLEDRTVKRTFRSWVEAGRGTLVTKRPVVPTDDELAHNRRARSAKLRCFERTYAS